MLRGTNATAAGIAALLRTASLLDLADSQREILTETLKLLSALARHPQGQVILTEPLVQPPAPHQMAEGVSAAAVRTSSCGTVAPHPALLITLRASFCSLAAQGAGGGGGGGRGSGSRQLTACANA